MITPEQALAIYHAGPEAVVKVVCELSRPADLLQKRVEELERKVAKLSKNSTNSSKSPSSDITRPKPEQRQQGKRQIGAQPGHPRHERPAFPEADIKNFHEYPLETCPECGNAEVTFLDEPPRVQQQMEIEEVIVRKEEHRSHPVWCERCQKVHYHPALVHSTQLVARQQQCPVKDTEGDLRFLPRIGQGTEFGGQTEDLIGVGEEAPKQGLTPRGGVSKPRR